MGNLTIATIFVVTVNILMFLVQTAVYDINPSGTVCYSTTGSIIEQTMASQGNGSVAVTSALDDLPGSGGSVTTGTGGSFFTDIFNNILSWFKTAPGIKYVYGVISAPYNILKCMDLPSEFSVAIGVLWYMVTLLILVAFLWGRD